MGKVSSVNIKRAKFPGVIEITADGWNGKALKMPHHVYKEWRKSGDIPVTAAVYMLYADHFDRARHGNDIYIGQTGKIDSRLDTHVAERKDWSVVLIVVSEDDWMNIAYTQNIENSFISWAKDANRYVVTNGNEGGTPHLGIEDQARLKLFLDGVRDVLELAGIDIFVTNLDGAFFKKLDFRGKTFASTIRIKTIGSPSFLTIDKGSKMWGIDDLLVSQAGLVGVIHDAVESTHTFTEEVEVEFDKDAPKLFGQSLSGWRNSCGISTTTVLWAQPPTQIK